MTAEYCTDLLVNSLPFLLYGALLFKLFSSWQRVRSMKDRCREKRIAAVLMLLTVCTLTFMAANAYALEVYGTTFLSLRVFQMFVLSNCAAYWLVSDLITKDACE